MRFTTIKNFINFLYFYRLNNDLKQNITCKTKLLAEEIKLVNSLKAANVHKLVAITTGSNPTEMQPKRKEISAEEKLNVLRTETSIGEGDPPNNNLKENCEKTTTEQNEEKASDEFSTDLGATTESAEVQQVRLNTKNNSKLPKFKQPYYNTYIMFMKILCI